jgi:ComF family protein
LTNVIENGFRRLLVSCHPKKWIHRGLNLFYPLRCPCCNELFPEETVALSGWTQICSSCQKRLLPQEKSPCLRCGAFFPISTETEFPPQKRFSCVHCSKDVHFFKRAVTLGEYSGELREAVLRLKEETSGYFATALASLLLQVRGEEIHALAPDYIIPVPMHYARRIIRGVNNPEFLAEELGRRLKIPVLSGLVRRIRSTNVQFELTPRQRVSNIKNAFELKLGFWKRLRRIRVRELLAGKKILLTDDILTTGATTNEIARLLLDNGASSVDVCVFARAVGEH